MNSIYKCYYKSPIGILKISSIENAICSIDFVNNITEDSNVNETLKKCCTELEEYFEGKRKTFDLKINLAGTDFQTKVWNELINIPYGETVCYLDIAENIGNEKAVRAVGNANNKNKIPIIVPCHRVIGKNGKLVGYAGGLWVKEWLLNHERQFKED